SASPARRRRSLQGRDGLRVLSPVVGGEPRDRLGGLLSGLGVHHLVQHGLHERLEPLQELSLHTNLSCSFLSARQSPMSGFLLVLDAESQPMCCSLLGPVQSTKGQVPGILWLQPFQDWSQLPIPLLTA